MVRRSSGKSTRDEIHSAASQLFREHGFARTSVRAIAALAQTSPALVIRHFGTKELVIRHFGTKELLFLETVHLTMDSEPLLDMPLESLGERFVAVLLSADEDIRSVYLALVRGSDEPRIAVRLKESHETAFASYVVWTDEADDHRCRGWLADRMAALEPVTAGQYLGDSDFTTRQVRFTSDAHWARLCEVRRRWDPDSVFAGYLATADAPLNTNHWEASQTR
jgi:AcrR family transcriptional regulator